MASQVTTTSATAAAAASSPQPTPAAAPKPVSSGMASPASSLAPAAAPVMVRALSYHFAESLERGAGASGTEVFVPDYQLVVNFIGSVHVFHATKPRNVDVVRFRIDNAFTPGQETLVEDVIINKLTETSIAKDIADKLKLIANKHFELTKELELLNNSMQLLSRELSVILPGVDQNSDGRAHRERAFLTTIKELREAGRVRTIDLTTTLPQLLSAKK